MRLMMAFMPSCRELSETLAGEGLSSLPWHRRLTATAHLLHCDVCARFARQLERIGEALRVSWARPQGAGLAELKARVAERLRRP